MRTPFLSPSRRVWPPSVPAVRDQGAADNLRGALLMATSMVAFTCNDALLKAAVLTLPTYEAVTIRGAMVMALMAAMAGIIGGVRLRIPSGDLWPLILRTAGDVGSTGLFVLALGRMPLANLSAIMQVLPLAVTLGAALVFREKLGWRRLSAIFIGFAGVMLILRPGTGAFDLWSGVALAAMLMIVLRDLATRTFSRAVGTSTIAFYGGAGVTVMGLILGLGEDWRLPGPDEAGLLAGAAGFLTIGYISAVASMRVGEISFVAPFRYTSLVWAILLGLVMFAEWPDIWTWTGSALVVGAGLYSILRERRLGRRG